MKYLVAAVLAVILSYQIVHAGCIVRFLELKEVRPGQHQADLYTDNVPAHEITTDEGGNEIITTENGIEEFFEDLPNRLLVSNLSVISYVKLENGKSIVKVLIPKNQAKRMAALCARLGVDDPFTTEGVVAMDIVGSFAGRTREDVLTKYPELAGQIEVDTDENGNPIMVDKFPLKKWSCED